jgi:hypothetical protein
MGLLSANRKLVVPRKLTNTEIAEAKALLERNLLAAGKTIDPGSAAANIDKWLRSAELRPPVAPRLACVESDSERCEPKTKAS